MRVVHFDCVSGISGDMFLGALVGAGVPFELLQTMLASLGLPVTLEVETVKRCSLAATKVNVLAKEEESYRFLPDIRVIVDRGGLSQPVKHLAMRIFTRLAEAEAAAHGIAVEKVHFHEVGALDSIADIVLAAVGIDHLAPDVVTASPVPTGSGTVKCAHGTMPVPTPATLHLLKGVPLAPSTLKFELTTPTGAAILTTIVNEYTAAPAMTVEAVGTGAGTRDFLEHANILRLLVGTSSQTSHFKADAVVLLETNLDDCPGEVIGYTLDRLFAAGALDAFTMPIQMKKNRPGVLVSVLAPEAKVPELERILFAETGTFGIRKAKMERSILQREIIEVDTPWGKVRAKRGWREGIEVLSPEYEDCARVAKTNGVPLTALYNAVSRSDRSRQGSS